jgi:curved DNA-binding protein CbpA
MFSQNKEDSHYTTLGIPETASSEEIKKAYR